MYDIARYIPLDIRLDMAAVTYDQRDKKGRLQCADGKCPMGWLPDVGNDRPWSKEIADWVCEQRGTDDPELYEKVYTAAKEFTDDFDEKSAPNRPTRHTLIRDIAVGPNGEIRATETMEVEIIWPTDRTGWNTGGGDWRVLNPPPIGYYVDHANEPAAEAIPEPIFDAMPEPSMETLKQDEISRQREREEWAGAAGRANDDAIVDRENRRSFEMETERHA